MAARRHGVEVTRKTFDDAKIKVDAGTANRVELTRAQVAWERAIQALEEADAGRAQAYRSLATVTGIDGPFVVDPARSEAGDRYAPGEDLGSMALKLRPEFAQLEGQVAAADATADSYRWRWLPTLSGFGNVRGFNYGGFANQFYAWAVGLQLDWVVYDGGLRDAQRRFSVAQRSESEFRLAQLRRTVSDDIENARRSLAVRHRALETATRAAQLSKETLDLVRVQHSAGTATQLDLLTAQDQHIASMLLQAQARFQLALADLTLQRQVGTFPAIAMTTPH